MRYQLGVMGCVLAGCATQPTTTSRSPASVLDAATPIPAPRHLLADAALPPFVLRIGVEHLPPDERAALEPPRLEAIAPSPAARPGPQEPPQQPTTLVDRAAQRWRYDLTQLEDPMAREALRFVSDLVEADRDRARQQIGIPFFDLYDVDPDRGPLLASEEALQADHEEWAQTHGRSLLRRPLRQLLRRLPIAQAVELDFDEFRSDHLPLSEPYEEAHRDSAGRVSVRVRTGDLDDPLEVAYVFSGVRIGTSQDTCKFGINWELMRDLTLALRAHTMYTVNDKGLRADLAYRATPRMTLHMAIGDDMDFLSTSSHYSLLESPMDGSPGLVLYAVHVF